MKKTLICSFIFLGAASLVAQSPRAILPIVGSAQGGFGSNFRTELQLYNRSTQPMVGTLVFHPIGRSAESGDPRLDYTLEPHQTIEYQDIVAALGTSGLGSLDFVVTSGGVPVVMARAFDDQDEEGTSGTNIALVDPRRAFDSGDSAVLVLPEDRQRFRFNVGVRTLEGGVHFFVTIYGANGTPRSIVGEIVYPANFLIQQPAEAFAGTTLLANESLGFEILSGSAIIYGTTTDNATNDPNVQIAQN